MTNDENRFENAVMPDGVEYESRDDFEAEVADRLEELDGHVDGTFEIDGTEIKTVAVGISAVSINENGDILQSAFRALDPELPAEVVPSVLGHYNDATTDIGYHIGLGDHADHGSYGEQQAMGMDMGDLLDAMVGLGGGQSPSDGSDSSPDGTDSSFF